MNAEAPPNATPHVDEVTGLLYIEGQLEQAAARTVVKHVEQCSNCRRLLDSLKRESLLLRQALTEEDEAVPASLLVPRSSAGLSWWWLSVLSLAATGAYAIWTYYLEPWVSSFQETGFGGQFFFTWLLLNGASWKGWTAMLQWVIVASLGVLASVVLFLLRRNLRRLTSLSVFLAALLLAALALPQAAQGAEFVHQTGTYLVPAGETVRNDLFVFAPSVRVSGTVDGDLYCFSHVLSIDGRVTGDVIAFVGDVRIAGKVDGNVRSFNQSLTLDGEVGRNVLSFVAQYETSPKSHVGGSAMLLAGLIQVEGPMDRDLTAYLGEGSIDAPVGGSVRIRQEAASRDDRWVMHNRGPLQVGSHADIKGSFRVRGPVRPEISPEAHLASAPQFDLVEELPPYRNPKAYWYNAMIWGSAFLVGLVLISLVPGLMNESAREAGRIGVPLGLGLVTFILMPVTGCLACFTVVGLGLGLPVIFLWLFLFFFGQVPAALWVGDSILGRSSGAWSATGRLALGLLLIRLLALVPVLGAWVRFLACLLGIGALTLMALHRIQPQAGPAPAAPAA
jgi:hypothetical protein